MSPDSRSGSRGGSSPRPVWRLSPVEESAEQPRWAQRRGSGSFWVDLASAVWTRKGALVAFTLLAMTPYAVWLWLNPTAYEATQRLQFQKELLPGDQARLIKLIGERESVEAAASAGAASPEDVLLDAQPSGTRSLIISVLHRTRAGAPMALQGAVAALSRLSPLAFEAQGSPAVAPRWAKTASALRLAAIGLLALLCGAAAAWRLERRSEPVRDTTELAELTGTRVLVLTEETPSHVS